MSSNKFLYSDCRWVLFLLILLVVFPSLLSLILIQSLLNHLINVFYFSFHFVKLEFSKLVWILFLLQLVIVFKQIFKRVFLFGLLKNTFDFNSFVFVFHLKIIQRLMRLKYFSFFFDFSLFGHVQAFFLFKKIKAFFWFVEIKAFLSCTLFLSSSRFGYFMSLKCFSCKKVILFLFDIVIQKFSEWLLQFRFLQITGIDADYLVLDQWSVLDILSFGILRLLIF